MFSTVNLWKKKKCTEGISKTCFFTIKRFYLDELIQCDLKDLIFPVMGSYKLLYCANNVLSFLAVLWKYSFKIGRYLKI